ncbi:adenylosuccinate lyase [candidate division KSB1 bacterium]|nr:adenylosuccinate lyase [candidate division KSB1 bacterium]
MERAISPLDGRYEGKLKHLGDYFSEFALMRMRCMVELQYIEALDRTGKFPKLTEQELERIHITKHNFSREDYDGIKKIESTLNHDVKACEVYLRQKIQLTNNNMIHFGLTSEDVNNLSYTMLLKDYVENEQIPQIEDILRELTQIIENWMQVPFPCRTHGQKASPSTVGKEIAVFVARLIRQFKKLKQLQFMGKLNGATGTFSALAAAIPDFDWLYFSCNFLERLGLIPNIATTQIEDHDTWAEFFAIVKRLNNIILDLDRDMWLYMTLGYFTVESDSESVGSSTMPHKVNPINFENSEGNLEISNALLDMLISKLGHSRMQRDLSDSTVTRNIGVALAHSYLAFSESIKGLKKVRVNEAKCLADLEDSPELLAEPIQTILKVEGIDDPYTLLKDFTRGRKITRQDIDAFVDQLDIRDEVKQRIRELQPSKYIGLADEICSFVLEDARSELLKGDIS